MDMLKVVLGWEEPLGVGYLGEEDLAVENFEEADIGKETPGGPRFYCFAACWEDTCPDAPGFLYVGRLEYRYW